MKNMSGTQISLVKGLELLYPFRYKNMTKINFSRMKTPRSNSISILYAITIDSNMMRYLKTICVVGKSKPVTCHIYMLDAMRFLKRKK
jgi:hypothetical protein